VLLVFALQSFSPQCDTKSIAIASGEKVPQADERERIPRYTSLSSRFASCTTWIMCDTAGSTA
jgi:hypothetical protein